MLLVILLLAPAGCKKEPPPMAAMSPLANPPPAASDPDDPATDPDPPSSPRTDDKNDWRRQKPGTGSGSAAATKEPAKAPAAKPDEEDPAAKAKRLAKIATQRAADAALGAASKAMKDCYDRAKAPSATATISFSVRSTGYVSAPRVKGVEPTVASCIENVLRDLRVRGVQSAGLVVERTLRFTRR